MWLPTSIEAPSTFNESCSAQSKNDIILGQNCVCVCIEVSAVH